MRPVRRVLPVGASGVLLQTAEGGEATALHAELTRRRERGALPGVSAASEFVPAACTVLVTDLADPRAFAADVVRWDIPPIAELLSVEVELAVRFDGPDLADVAAAWGVAPERVADIVTGTPMRVAFCGFTPGFGYVTGLPADRAVPRRATARTRVPAGSVGLAGPYAGVYPRASPGGWQLIGRTDAVLWDAARDPAALLSPGAAVRFTAAPS